MTSKNNTIKPQKVLHITRIAKGGVAVVLDQLARGLDKTKFEPVVLFDTPQDSDIRQQLILSSIQTIELVETRDILCEQKTSSGKKHNNRKSRVENLFGNRAYQIYLSMKSVWKFVLHELPKIKRFKCIIKDNNIVLVHTHSDLRRAKPEILAARLAGVPCVTHRHGYSNYTWFDKLFAGLVKANIYISNDVARHHIIQDENPSKGVIIHNGVNLADYEKEFDSKEVRQELRCNLNQSLIGLVARLDWWKGHEFFIEAIAEVAQQHDNIKGLIIGGIAELHYNSSQRYLDMLHEMVQSMGLQKIITFIEHRSDIPRLLSALDVVVHASSTPEPFGLTVIEGMSAGKPVVATAAGGVLDIIEDRKNGLLVPCKNSNAMARAIMLLLSDRDKKEQIGYAAKQRVAERFTITKQVYAVQMLYKSILDIT